MKTVIRFRTGERAYEVCRCSGGGDEATCQTPHMKQGRALEQRIAVFSESGSGKAVLLSSFYGAGQEPGKIKSSRFNVVSENPTQGTQLSQNYLGVLSVELEDADEAAHLSSKIFFESCRKWACPFAV